MPRQDTATTADSPGADSGARPRLRQRLTAWMMSRAAPMYDEALADRKQALLGGLRGTVLELGPGTGNSLRYYDPSVAWIGLEPNPAMRSRLRLEAERLGRVIDLRDGVAERTGVPDASVDAVVSSLVLCGVPDLPAALGEVLRILRPGGVFVVLEHVLAPPGSLLRHVQRWASRPWRAMFEGCHPDRDTPAAIEAAGFVEIALERFDGPLPLPIVRPHVMGTARRPRTAS